MPAVAGVPGPTSGANGPIGVRIRAKQTADTRNEIALTANAAAGDPRISSTAPSAGPTTIATFMIADISAFTEARPRSSTRAGIDACRLGLCATWVRDVEQGDHEGQGRISSGGRERGEHEHRDRLDEVARDQQASSVEAVRHQPPDRRHHDPRHEARHLHGRDPGDGARRVEDVDDERDAVEPVSRLGHGLPGQEQAEVAMPQHVAHAGHPSLPPATRRNAEHRAPGRGRAPVTRGMITRPP